jgi:hypothetical protein
MGIAAPRLQPIARRFSAGLNQQSPVGAENKIAVHITDVIKP